MLAFLEARQAHNVPVRRDKEQIRNATVDEIVAGIGPGDWAKAEVAALRVLEKTDKAGRNPIYEAMLDYQDWPRDDDPFWGAMTTVEVCVQLAPWLATREAIVRLAEHPVSSVRSTAASICVSLANIAPERIPTDVLIKLAVANEDWYVQAPATAALEAMAAKQRPILRVFLERLYSDDRYVREHAAEAIRDIAREEPQILSGRDLRKALRFLQRHGNDFAFACISEALPLVPDEGEAWFKYGL